MKIGKYVKRYKNPKRIVVPITIPEQKPIAVPEPVRVPLTQPERGHNVASR